MFSSYVLRFSSIKIFSYSEIPFIIEINFNCYKAEEIDYSPKQVHCFSKIYSILISPVVKNV